MIESEVFNVSEAGVVTLMHYDHADDTIVFETKQDVEPLLDLQHERQANKSDFARWAGDWHHVGCIPPQILARMRQQCFEWQADGSRRLNKELWGKKVTDWLNENSKFRSVPWRV